MMMFDLLMEERRMRAVCSYALMETGKQCATTDGTITILSLSVDN